MRICSSLFLVSALVGFAVFKFLGADSDGGEPKVGFNLLLFRTEGNCDHIHHWMVFAALSVAVAAAVRASGGSFQYPAIVAYFGFALGASLEDLTYGDWYRIEQPCLTLRNLA